MTNILWLYKLKATHFMSQLLQTDDHVTDRPRLFKTVTTKVVKLTMTKIVHK